MSITEAFEGVVPVRPVPPDPDVARASRPAAARSAARTSPRPGAARRLARVVWLDATDSWIVREHSPSPRTVWRTDYTAHLDSPHPAYVNWCRVWRPIGTAAGAALDGLKVLVIHPIRGPLTVSAAAVIYEIATH